MGDNSGVLALASETSLKVSTPALKTRAGLSAKPSAGAYVSAPCTRPLWD